MLQLEEQPVVAFTTSFDKIILTILLAKAVHFVIDVKEPVVWDC